jgi:SNF2 family DNA or RNA helicase
MDQFLCMLERAKLDYKQYQYDGVEWCFKNETNPNPIQNVRGGFIADEMGLGKTIMMIGLMVVNKVRRTLIVVPPALIYQWHSEIERITGHDSLIYHGNEKKDITQEEFNNAPIVLTTYHTVPAVNSLLGTLSWNRIIYDEGHHLRNNNKRYQACKRLKSVRRWIVTGTPMQNRKKDLYNLCSILGMKFDFYANDANLRLIGKHFILRRTKAQVGIELPNVNTIGYDVEWKNKSEYNLAKEVHSLLPKITAVKTSGSLSVALRLDGKGTFSALSKARQVCVMPSMLKQKVEYLKSLDLVNSDYDAGLDTSSKIDAVINLILKRKDNNNGKIVFCQFREEIDCIALQLKKGGIEKIVKYDGRNSSYSNLTKLSEPADVIILQIQTTCEGLNLQKHFSEIYFVSYNWNPFIEEQAIARCHRIGQTNVVNVFRFIMGNLGDKNEINIEKYIDSVQKSKRALCNTILSAMSD